MKHILLILLFAGTLSAYSQKNVVPSDSSKLTGIMLPSGTKQDNRIISKASAKYLLDERLKETGKASDGTVEVFYLLPDQGGVSKKTFLVNLEKKGYKFAPLPGDDHYGIIAGRRKEFLVYLNESNSEVALYISGITATAVKPAETPPDHGQTKESSPPDNVKTSVQAVVKPAEQPVKHAASRTAFHFTTTNFDDGWIAAEHPDYVLVTKGNITVKLFYAVEITDQMRSPSTDLAQYFWNEVVVPRYRVKQAYKYEAPLSFFSTYYIYGEATDNSSSKECFIGMNAVVASGISSVVVASAPDKQSFDAAFPDPAAIEKMLGYNRFAIAYGDIVGKWAESSGATAQYYNVYTGAYAGMGFAQGDDEFVFNPDKTYSSKHVGAMGSVGNTTFYNQEYKGSAISGNWDLSLTNRWKGQQDDFHAWFECVKGGRILHLVNKTASGIKYDLIRVE